MGSDAMEESPISSIYNILERISDGFVALDKNWYYVYVNNRAGEIFGRRPEDLIGKHIWTEFPEGIDQPFYKAYYRAMEEQVTIKMEEYFSPWDRWFENRIYPSPEGLTIFFTEITDSVKTRKALQEKETVLRLFVEYSPAALAMFDRDMKYIVASRRYLLDYNLGEQDLIGRSHYDVFPEMPERWKEIHRRCLAGAIEKCDEDPFPRADGRIDWVRWEIRPWYETTGEVGGIILFSEVITDRIQMRDALKESEEKFSLAFNSSPAMLALGTIDGKHVDVNKAYADFLGFSREEILGKTIDELQVVTWEERQRVLELAREGGGSLYNSEVKVRLRDGSFRYVLFSLKTISLGGVPHGLATFLDITDRKQAELALIEATESLSFIVEGTETGLWNWDLTTNRVHYSREWKQMLGYEEHEVADHLDEWRRLTHPDDISPTFAKVNAYLQQPAGTLEAEFRMRHKSGEYCWILSRATAQLDDQGKPVRLLGLHINITDRKQAEELLKESESKFRAIIEASPVPYALNDEQQNITYLNAAFINTFGYNLQDIPTLSDWWPKAYPDPEYRQWVADTWQARLEKSKQTGTHFEPIELDIRCKDGTLRTAIAAAVPLGETFKGVHLVILYDITERKEAEAEISISAQELSTINKVMTICASSLDLNEILQNVLDEYLVIAGIEGGTICLLGPDDTFSLAAHRGASDATINDFAVNNIHVGECLCGSCAYNKKPLILRTPEEVLEYATREVTRGEDIRFHAAFPFTIRDKCLGVLCVFTRTDKKPMERSLRLLETISSQISITIENAMLYKDSLEHAVQLEKTVTERTRELKDANIRLQELDRLKSMFIASMSHELRTPLNSIIGFTGIILMGMSGDINEEQRKQLSIVEKSARHLLALISDVIDVSKIEAEKVELYIEKFDLSILMREVIESFSHSADEKKLKMSLDAPAELMIESDERRIKQVLNNLLSNAVKFTDNGRIDTKVIEEENNMIKITVRDTGIGIKDADKQNLFKAFSKFTNYGIPTPEGTGLGLYLSQKIAGLLGGELKAESEFGKGSTFTFIFTPPPH